MVNFQFPLSGIFDLNGVQAILKKLGYRPDLARDGQQAIEALRRQDYHLVLMDCQMPKMDGYEAARAIRSGSAGLENPNVPIIAMTANVMRGDREKTLQAGCNGYIPKPIDVDELPYQIARFLKAKGL